MIIGDSKDVMNSIGDEPPLLICGATAQHIGFHALIVRYIKEKTGREPFSVIVGLVLLEDGEVLVVGKAYADADDEAAYLLTGTDASEARRILMPVFKQRLEDIAKYVV